MARHGRHITLEDLPPAYREQAERQLRAAVAGSEPRHEPARPAAPICSNKAFAPTCPECGPADFASDLPPLLRHRDDAAPAALAAPAAPTPGVSQRSAKGRSKQPNPTERKFQLEMLGGKGRFEAVTFRTAGGAYTPDWVVADEGGMTCYEVKGSYGYASENRAKFAFLATREAFPCVRFRWFRSTKGGVWKEEYRA